MYEGNHDFALEEAAPSSSAEFKMEESHCLRSYHNFLPFNSYKMGRIGAKLWFLLGLERRLS